MATIATVMPVPIQQFADQDGNPLVGGLLYSYVPGISLAPQAVYTDPQLSIPYANPIVLDAAGTPGGAVYPQPKDYRFILKDAAGDVIFDTDDIVAVVPAA